MFDWPMSSPQMMTMFGFRLLRICQTRQRYERRGENSARQNIES